MTETGVVHHLGVNGSLTAPGEQRELDLMLDLLLASNQVTERRCIHILKALTIRKRQDTVAGMS